MKHTTFVASIFVFLFRSSDSDATTTLFTTMLQFNDSLELVQSDIKPELKNHFNKINQIIINPEFDFYKTEAELEGLQSLLSLPSCPTSVRVEVNKKLFENKGKQYHVKSAWQDDASNINKINSLLGRVEDLAEVMNRRFQCGYCDDNIMTELLDSCSGFMEALKVVKSLGLL
jgi:hypothetical protein